MEGKIFMLTFVVFLQLEAISAQRQWVPPTTTAAEMRNPYTWYWPYAIAASESYREYYINAQQISNQLYHQAYLTQAFGSPQQQDNNGNSRGKGYPRWGWYGRYGRYGRFWWHHAGKNPGTPPPNVPEETPELEY